MGKRFFNVDPVELQQNWFERHRDEGCIVCQSETESEEEFTKETDFDASYENRYICTNPDCEAMVTKIAEDFIEFYLEQEDKERLLGDVGVGM